MCCAQGHNTSHTDAEASDDSDLADLLGSLKVSKPVSKVPA